MSDDELRGALDAEVREAMRSAFALGLVIGVIVGALAVAAWRMA